MSVLMFKAVGLIPLSLAIAAVALKARMEGAFFEAGAIVLLVTVLEASHSTVGSID
jgi:hypothetical protein